MKTIMSFNGGDGSLEEALLGGDASLEAPSGSSRGRAGAGGSSRGGVREGGSSRAGTREGGSSSRHSSTLTATTTSVAAAGSPSTSLPPSQKLLLLSGLSRSGPAPVLPNRSSGGGCQISVPVLPNRGSGGGSGHSSAPVIRGRPASANRLTEIVATAAMAPALLDEANGEGRRCSAPVIGGSGAKQLTQAAAAAVTCPALAEEQADAGMESAGRGGVRSSAPAAVTRRRVPLDEGSAAVSAGTSRDKGLNKKMMVR